MSDDNNQTTPGQPDTVPVSDLDQFVRHLVAWHQMKVTELEHMLKIPQGVEVTFNDEGPQVLTGDLHKGFLIGLSLGLMELGSLPFVFETEEVPPSTPVDEPVKH